MPPTLMRLVTKVATAPPRLVDGLGRTTLSWPGLSIFHAKRRHHPDSIGLSTVAGETWEHVYGRTILTPRASSDGSTARSIIRCLPVVPARRSSRSNVVILLTPSLAGLAEGQFLTECLGRLLPASARCPTSSEQCAVLAAVVDRVPSLPMSVERDHAAQSVGDAGGEGVSVLVLPSSTSHNAPVRIADTESHGPPSQLASQQLGHLSLNLSPKLPGAGFARRKLGLPLANTVFITGKECTMNISNWQLAEGSNEWVEQSKRDTTQAELTLPELDTEGCSDISIKLPLVPLTNPRKISDGFGNIVRRVQGDSDATLPASQELERSVEAYFRSAKLMPQQTKVWGLILPQENVLASGPQGITYGDVSNTITIPISTKIETTSSDPGAVESILSDLIGLRARLHRVLSGGGGWGKKQGLLSLDPESSYLAGSRPEHRSLADMADFGTASERLGQVAKPGDFVQFFISPAVSRHDSLTVSPQQANGSMFTSEADSHESRGLISGGRTLLTFGVTEVSDDYLAGSQETSQPEVECDSLTALDGCFGALSAKGISHCITLGSESDRATASPTTETKIDVPFARVEVTITATEGLT